MGAKIEINCKKVVSEEKKITPAVKMRSGSQGILSFPGLH